MSKSILIVDDDPDVLKIFKLYLESEGFSVVTAEDGVTGLQKAEALEPNLIMLDVMMPGMNGYEVCSKLQKNENLSYIPVIFVTALGSEQNKAMAFSCGAVDYIVKPPTKKLLVDTVHKHLETTTRWTNIHRDVSQLKKLEIASFKFNKFKQFLAEKINLSEETKKKLDSMRPSNLYNFSSLLNISTSHMAQYMAEFFEIPYVSYIDPETIQLDALPSAFCRAQSIVAVSDESGKKLVLSNPFNYEIIDSLTRLDKTVAYSFAITEPENINLLFSEKSADSISLFNIISESQEISAKDIEKKSIIDLTNSIIYKAISQRASDIHIEPKETGVIIRFRIDGDMRTVSSITDKTGVKIIARLKILANLDIAEKRRPQDGVFGISIGGKELKLRVATTSTPFGESCVIRLLEAKINAKSLESLGMTDKQSRIMKDFVSQTKGLVLVVGVTGSGKTTTIYSLINHIDCKKRSLISVEDPVEYTIPDASQQQVNEVIGLTFEKLLRSTMRQDPDILFIGEVRDSYSASTAIEAATTGHLTITTVHAAGVTEAIHRFEVLGVSREKLAEALIGICAQKLLKVLCPYCKKVQPPSTEERELLLKYTSYIPTQIAQPVGCPRCNYTGYYGREAVYEIVKVDHAIREKISAGEPVFKIRNYMRQSGEYLLVDSALEKLANLKFSLPQVFENVLASEEAQKEKVKQPIPAVIANEAPTTGREAETTAKKHILLVEDDTDTQMLISRLLENRGYAVTTASDGIDALLKMGSKTFDLILSDIEMPNLDGLKLVEMISQKGIKSPVLFLTAKTSSEDELTGLKMGAVDYIKKPFEKETLLLKVKRILQ